jgi:hypothetical protein
MPSLKTLVLCVAAVIVCAVATVADTSNATATTSPSPSDHATQYGIKLFTKLKEQLKIERVVGQTLTDNEYNAAVDNVEALITGKFELHKKQLRKSILNFLARMSDGEIEQFFEDVAFELVAHFMSDTLEEGNTSSGHTAIDRAHSETRSDFADLDKDYIIPIGSSIVGCALVIAVVIKTASSHSKKSAAAKTDISILADSVIEGFAESQANSTSKDHDCKDIDTSLPIVTSV